MGAPPRGYAALILVDTSAWIDFFRGRDPLARAVDRLIESNEVALCGPVVAEIRRGLRSRGERARVIPLLSGCHRLSDPLDLWEAAGDLGYALGRRGITVKTIDLLVATYALSHGGSHCSRLTPTSRRCGTPALSCCWSTCRTIGVQAKETGGSRPLDPIPGVTPPAGPRSAWRAPCSPPR